MCSHPLDSGGSPSPELRRIPATCPASHVRSPESSSARFSPQSDPESRVSAGQAQGHPAQNRKEAECNNRGTKLELQEGLRGRNSRTLGLDRQRLTGSRSRSRALARALFLALSHSLSLCVCVFPLFLCLTVSHFLSSPSSLSYSLFFSVLLSLPIYLSIYSSMTHLSLLLIICSVPLGNTQDGAFLNPCPVCEQVTISLILPYYIP